MNAFQVYATYEYDYDRYKVVPICVFFFLFTTSPFAPAFISFTFVILERENAAADVDTVLP